MCGRYASARSVADLASTFGISAGDLEAAPAADWNVAPTKPVPAVLVAAGRRVLTIARWGLRPSWAPAGAAAPPLVNARVESVLDKPAFRDAVASRRCLLPADGWYEWARWPDGRRVPHFLTAADGSLLALAGIWEPPQPSADDRTAAVVTGPAPTDLAAVHDRAPLVLPPAAWAAWLDPATPPAEVRALLRPTAAGTVVAWPVRPDVGDVRAGGARLAERVELAEQPALF